MTVAIVGCSAPYRESVLARLAERVLDDDIDLVLIECDRPERWAQLVEQCAVADRVVVAILPELSIDDYVEAFALGADGAVYIDTPSQTTADVAVAALQREVLLPRQLVWNLALLAKRIQPPSDLTDSEIELLRAVARGRTIVDLARERFFSERTLRRQLQGLYLKLGVLNRAEAIAAATRMGLIE